ncbi:hypothetical protein BDV96DRAFT_601970 [Lophiotrema nucula]|uniref:Uncharacterized protein n=1 Tax=Lophiotrema nucula TaxID=690887 RepID=A0A6A5YZL8_9PLEO|nr:hypothetical protein BDV96DRAFT_601970 [Lophiotrema nucula]
MAADYVDKGTQTMIAGLSKHPAAVPPVLHLHTNTTTPPDDMPGKELQLPTDRTPGIMRTGPQASNTSPTLLLRRKNRPPLIARISLPASEYTENPRSPPPTEAMLSPLPAANRLHAGHTPIFPRSLSPLRAPQDDSGPPTPEQEEALTGPLTLPAQPGDGTEDRIELKALDAELEKIAKEQENIEPGSSPSQSAELGGQHSRKSSAVGGGRRRSSASDAVEVVDGVILKKPRMNMGAPLGQA